MKRAVVTIEGVSPYSQSRYYSVPKKNEESPADYEVRTWRERLHVADDGYVQIPPMTFKNNLSDAAMFLGMKIPGKGSSKYTKHFEAGIMVLAPLKLPQRKEDVEGEWLFLPSDGKRGGGKRVQKCMPLIRAWGGDVEYIIVDDTITEDVFCRHVDTAGSLIGIGRFRPRKNGYYGRFKVNNVAFEDYS